MTNAALTADDTFNSSADELDDYRSLHTGSILGLLLALLSIVYPISVGNLTDVKNGLLLLGLPLTALGVALWSYLTIRSNRETLTGERLALAGLAIAIVFLIGGTSYGAYVYATELPPGHIRTSFQEMRPSADDIEAGEPIPPTIQKLLNGNEPIFIKGYIRPDSIAMRVNLREFLLVRDNNQCCFGDVTKVMFYDQMKVTLGNDLAVDYKERLYRVGGKLTIRPGNTAIGEPPFVYMLAGDYIKY